jgi:hypothetical protein
LSFPLATGIADPQGHPIAGTEFVDNDRFKYSVEAVFLITRPPSIPGPLQLAFKVHPGIVVIESFEVDCIVA